MAKKLGRSPLLRWVLFIMLFLSTSCMPGANRVQSSLVGSSAQVTGFTRATGPTSFSFPADHGPHPDFQTEWWYYTGNLQTAEGRHFGYQLTFFRRALLPQAKVDQSRTSEWAADQVYMAHFALSDVEGEAFNAFERFARGAAGLAGAQAAPFAIWLENWQVVEAEPGTYSLSVEQADLALVLQLQDKRAPILQGRSGYSQKGPEPGNASYYYSMSRLETRGEVRVAGQSFAVSGWSWMDHEYSTMALSPGQIGWDWFSIQLDNDQELMLFQIRREDGSIDPFSGGALISADGRATTFDREAFRIQVESLWRSPSSGAEYPARWQVTVPQEDLTLSLRPLLAEQELNLSYSYWEGAVVVEGSHQGQAVGGYGYVEMTGYAGSMEGQF